MPPLPLPYCQKDSAVPRLKAHGCGLFATLWITDWATGGAISPTGRVVIDNSARDILRQSGVSDAEFDRRGTTLGELEQGYEAEADEFRRRERVAPRMRLFHGGSLEDDAWPALSAGRAVLVAVNYGVVQDGNVPTGSTFRGGHWVVLAGIAPGPGRRVTVANSLRRQLDVWNWALVVRAAEAFGRRPWGN